MAAHLTNASMKRLLTILTRRYAIRLLQATLLSVSRQRHLVTVWVTQNHTRMGSWVYPTSNLQSGNTVCWLQF